MSILNKVSKIFTSPSINQRINTFTTLSNENSPTLNVDTVPIIMPDILKRMKGGELKKWIQDKKIETNVRILHAVAHIQLNAFLAYAQSYFLFSSSPMLGSHRDEFREDMMSVGKDEGRHCLQLVDRLKELGVPFGTLPVVEGLTQDIIRTQHHLLDRLAIVALVHEGQGKRAVKRLITNLEQVDDEKSASILREIEIQQHGHYRKGLKWFIRLQPHDSIPLTIDRINREYRCNLQYSRLIQQWESLSR